MGARWADPRRRIEIIRLDKGSRRRRAGRIEADDGVDRLRHIRRVVLADRDQSLMTLVEDEVGVADVLRRGDGDGRTPRILPVEALILEIRKPDDAIPRQVRAA